MIDRTQIMYEVLTGFGSLADSINDQAWSPVAPSTWDGSSACVVFHQDSGGSHITGATNSAEFVFKCYGGANTYDSSRSVFEKLYDKLQMVSIEVPSGKIMSARLVTDSQLPPTPDEDYKAHVARFSVTFAT